MGANIKNRISIEIDDTIINFKNLSKAQKKIELDKFIYAISGMSTDAYAMKILSEWNDEQQVHEEI